MNRIEEVVLNIQEGRSVEENSAVLWKHLERRLQAFFKHKGFPSETSKDLTQEVSLRLFRSIQNFRFESTIDTWTFAIAENVWRNTLRANAALKRQGREFSLDAPPEEESLGPPLTPIEFIALDDPLSRVLAQERQEFLRESIERLPPVMRRCVELRYGREVEVGDIASILEMPREDVKLHLSDARILLTEYARERVNSQGKEGVPEDLVISTDTGTKTEFSPIVSELIQVCNLEMLAWLARHPEDLERVHPGTFELIVADIFASEGFEVEAVSSWNQPDGGVDLIAVKRIADNVSIRLAIQCKKIKQERRVSAEPIRSLAGVLDRFRVHAGVVATTSYFTAEAQEEARQYFWRISLRDYDNILRSLREFSGFELQSTGLWLPSHA